MRGLKDSKGLEEHEGKRLKAATDGDEDEVDGSERIR